MKNPGGKKPLSGAGNGARTRDIKLGKLALYQLSYARPLVASRGSNVAQGGEAGQAPVGPGDGRTATPTCTATRARYTDRAMSGKGTTEMSTSLYFFPHQDTTEEQLRAILAGGSRPERARVIAQMLRYAQWDDIWIYVSREEVREIFVELDLPENLRTAWGRMLKVEAPVG